MSVYKRKGCYWSEVDKQKTFFVWAPAKDRFGRNFTTVQNRPEKRKNICLIKLVSKRKRAIRKGYTKFLVFSFLGFEVSVNRFGIKFWIKSSNSFFQKCGGGIKKCSQTWKSRLKFFWNVLWCPNYLKPQKTGNYDLIMTLWFVTSTVSC